MIAGCEAAWDFFGGIFKVVIPDNLKAIVIHADPIAPRLNDAFVEYSQARGFVIDPARVRRPRDKGRVERVVPYVRELFFKGEDFLGLADTQRRAEMWCVTDTGMRIHGTTQRRPAEVFKIEEPPTLAPPPQRAYDVPLWCEPKVHRDHHIEVQRALYSVPRDLIGRHVRRAPMRSWSRSSTRAKWSRSIPARALAGAPPTPPTSPRKRPSTRSETSTA